MSYITIMNRRAEAMMLMKRVTRKMEGGTNRRMKIIA
jgi:hypothetical protein